MGDSQLASNQRNGKIWWRFPMANDEERSLSRLCIPLTLSLIRYTFDSTSTDVMNFQQYWLLLIHVCVFYNNLCAIAWNIIIWIQLYTLELDFKHLIYVFDALNITWNFAPHRERKGETERGRERNIHNAYINTTAIVAMILAMVFSSSYRSHWHHTIYFSLLNVWFTTICTNQCKHAKCLDYCAILVYAIEKLW